MSHASFDIFLPTYQVLLRCYTSTAAQAAPLASCSAPSKTAATWPPACCRSVVRLVAAAWAPCSPAVLWHLMSLLLPPLLSRLRLSLLLPSLLPLLMLCLPQLRRSRPRRSADAGEAQQHHHHRRPPSGHLAASLLPLFCVAVSGDACCGLSCDAVPQRTSGMQWLALLGAR